MQDKAIQSLTGYLSAEFEQFNNVDFVDKREYGPNDFVNSVYIRLDSDRDARNYFRDGNFWVGLYVLIADVTDIKEDITASLISKLEQFPKMAIRCTDIGTNSDLIYKQETDEDLTADCSYLMIRFEGKTLDYCTTLC